MLKNTFTRRFIELQQEFESLKFENARLNGVVGSFEKEGKWQRFGTSAQNLLLAVFGNSAPHYINFVDAYNRCVINHGNEFSINSINQIFLSAKADFEGDCVFDVDLRISGEVFGDFVALARQSMIEGHKDVAAVLACAALEDALKRYAAINQLNVNDKTMQEVVNSLKTKGLVAGAQKTLLDAMPKIRNFAMHAEWSKISEPDVSSVLGFVEQFLLTKFSPN